MGGTTEEVTPSSPRSAVRWVYTGVALVVIGVAILSERLFAFRSAGLEPLEVWNVCKPRQLNTELDCVDPASIPTFWPVVVATVLACLGGLLLLGAGIARLRAHGYEVSSVGLP